jgi:hypothetical protein
VSSAQIAARCRGRGEQYWTDEELMDVLRDTARQAEQRGERFSASRLRERYQRGDRVPTQRTYALRYGSWNAACEAAGVPHAPSTAHLYTPWTQEQCVEAILAVAEVLGEMPSMGDYDAVRRLELPDLPSNATIRGRCRGWARALALAEAAS